MNSVIAILGAASQSGIAIDLHINFYEIDNVFDTRLLGNRTLVRKSIIARGLLTFATTVFLREVSGATASDIHVTYAKGGSLV